MLDTKTNFIDEKVEIDPKDLQVSFGDNTTETKDEKTKDKETNNDSKIVKVSLGNDSEALAEEKSKPKEKQDKVKKVQVTVNPIDANNVIGHKKENVQKLKDIYDVDLVLKQDKSIKQGKSKIDITETYLD